MKILDKLRPYQRAAHDAAITYLRTTTRPALIEAATGAGKSWIIAALAETMLRLSPKKKILILQPSKELTSQNFAKFAAASRSWEGRGPAASICSRSLGEVSTRGRVIYATPGTVRSRLEAFRGRCSLVIVDECEHALAGSLKIVQGIRELGNPHLRMIGLTATPYRMRDGYIYKERPDGGILTDELARAPAFGRCVYQIGGRALIDQGFLTPPVVLPTGENYDTSGLAMTRTGRWQAATLRQTFEGKGRLTSRIVEDFVRIADAEGLKTGIVFTTSIAHAEEVAASMPPDSFAIVHAKTPAKERAGIVERVKAGRLPWVVNVDILTRGFDAPNVDHAVFLRKTESPALLQQMIGRVLRLHPDKDRAIILDYAENIEAHFPGGRDLFDPSVSASQGKPGQRVEFTCEVCDSRLVSSKDPTIEGEAVYSPTGYLVAAGQWGLDKHGNKIAVGGYLTTTPAHALRRCPVEDCGHWWRFKECESCQAKNDQSARACTSCGSEIIDPNERLRFSGGGRRMGDREAGATYESHVKSVKLNRYTPPGGEMMTLLRVQFYDDLGEGELKFWISAIPMNWAQESTRNAVLIEGWGPLEMGTPAPKIRWIAGDYPRFVRWVFTPDRPCKFLREPSPPLPGGIFATQITEG